MIQTKSPPENPERFNRRIPQDFPVLAGDVLKAYADKHGKAEGLDASDLTVRPLGGAGDAWLIVLKATGLPVDDMTDGSFKTEELQRAAAARKDAEDEKTLKRIGDRYEPLVVIPGTSLGIGKPSLSGYSPAELAQIDANISRRGAEGGQAIVEHAQSVARGASKAKQAAEKRQAEIEDEAARSPRKSMREQLGDAIGLRGKPNKQK